jgi:hypothetical protein
MVMHPPPPPCTLYPSLARRNQSIGRRSGMPPPPGGATTSPDFLSSTPGCGTLCKPHKHNDVFPLCRTKSPSLTFNLVGRRLCLAKHAADTLPPSGRVSVYCYLPRRLIVHKRTTPAILPQKYLNAPLPPTPPPPIASPSSPLSRRASTLHAMR